ncbi:MAG: efflux RND transporter periplasmic adaptor subunit [Syntrophobacter sp.]
MRSSIAILSILALFVLSSCSSDTKTEQAANSAIPVRIGKIKQVREPERISVSGTVASPDAPAAVSFLVSGKVIRVGPREGEHVQKDQLLAAIDPTDYNLAVQAASAQVGQARIALDRSKDEYGRMKFLYESRSLAGNDFEKFKAAYLSAKQQLDQATANEKLSKKRLNDASLYAPISGFISKRSIEPGETASPGRPVFEIVTLDPVEMSVGVPETDIHLVRIGQTATIKIPALPGDIFEGTVRVIGVSADPNTRTYMTRITVPNPRHILRVGMVAEAHIQGDRILDLMTLPAEAFVRDPQGATMVFVYYPDQGRVYARRVGTGTVHGREIVVKSGLSGDESIVLAGQEKLRDGVSVSATAESYPSGDPGARGANEVGQ